MPKIMPQKPVVLTYKRKEYIVELAKTLKAHWYGVWEKKWVMHKEVGEKYATKGKFLGHFPSATTILNAYPQSEHLTRWIADNGWNEAQRIKGEAGERGTAVHSAIEFLLGGGELTERGEAHGMRRSYSLDEWWRLTTFERWYKEYKPEIIALEFPVFSKKGGFAGRCDAIARIDGKIYVIDWKTSSQIADHFPLQFAGYTKAIEEMTNLKIDATAALQLGAPNKNGYRFVVWEDWREHYKIFENVRAVWQYDQFDSKKTKKEPPVLEVPERIKLELPVVGQA